MVKLLQYVLLQKNAYYQLPRAVYIVDFHATIIAITSNTPRLPKHLALPISYLSLAD